MTLLALALLVPVVWGLLGAPPVPAAFEQLDALNAPPPPPPTPWMLTAFVLGALLSLGRARGVTVHVLTAAHEAGHALTAAFLGARLNRIALHRDGSGVAYSTLPRGARFRSLPISAAGYLTPGLLALAGVSAAIAGFASAWLAYLVAGTALVLALAVRSWWGVLVATLLVASGWGVLALGGRTLEALVVALLSGLLAAGGIADAGNQWRLRRGPGRTDASAMAGRTRLPAGAFAGAHLLAATVLAGAATAVTMGIWAGPLAPDLPGGQASSWQDHGVGRTPP